MKFYSINDPEYIVGWREAILKGAAPDCGLFLPEKTPKVSLDEYDDLRALNFSDLAVNLLWRWFRDDWKGQGFASTVSGVFNFPLEYVKLGDVWIAELFHGPSLSFKDFGARFLASSLDIALEEEKRDAILVTATSGDTGGAVAKAFAESKRVSAFVLYPAGKISRLQEKQITTAGGRVRALAVEGDFDDCQKLVKTALADDKLKSLCLTSANSINVGRLIPQTLYYIHAYLKTSSKCEDAVFSVPCGNFGNLTAGLLARNMGFPFRFVAACNENKTVPEYFATGKLRPHETRHTLSNAMDVGNPSNFPRVMALFGGDRNELLRIVSCTSSTDKQTLDAIRTVAEKYDYVLDPHGAVAWLGLVEQMKKGEWKNTVKIVIETAHPSKFPETIARATGQEAIVPETLADDMNKEGRSTPLQNRYEEFKKLILKG